MEHPQDTGLELVACPECGAPAEITDRFALESTDGPIEHVRVRCVDRRWFTMPTEQIRSTPVPAPAPPTGKEPGRWTPARRSS